MTLLLLCLHMIGQLLHGCDQLDGMLEPVQDSAVVSGLVVASVMMSRR